MTHTPTCPPIRERRQRAEHAKLPRRHRQGRGVEGQARFSLQRDRNSTGSRTQSVLRGSLKEGEWSRAGMGRGGRTQGSEAMMGLLRESLESEQ